MGLPARLIDHSTARASSARVARVDCEHRNACHLCFVCDKMAKLGEGPPVQTVTLALSGPNPLTNAGQFLDRNGKAVAFSRSNYLLRDAVRRVLAKPGLLPGELFEAPFGCLRASGLKSATTLGEFLTDAFDLGSSVGVALAIECDIDDAEIDAENAFYVDLAGVGHVADDRQEPFALNDHQIDFALAEGKQLALPFAADEWDHLSTIERPDAHSVWHQPEDAVVIGLGRVLPELDQPGLSPISLVRRVGVGDLGYAANGHLGSDPELSPSLAVGDLVQVELSDLANIKAHLGQVVACLVAALKRASEQVSLILRRLELNVGDKLHDSSIENPA